MALSSCLFLFRSFLSFLGADNNAKTFPRVPSLHHPSFTKKKNITTRARTIHTTRFISARVIYIYIYIRRPRRLLCFFLLFGLFLSLSLKRNTTTQNGEERHRRPTTQNTRSTSLRLCSKFTCIDLCAYLSLSLSFALSREKKRKRRTEEHHHRREAISDATTVRKKTTKRGKEERETTDDIIVTSFSKGNWAPPKTVASFCI